MKQHKKKENRDLKLGIKLLLAGIAGVLYYFIVKMLCRMVYPSALYFLPSVSATLALIICFVIVLAGISINAKWLKQVGKNPKIVIGLGLISLMLLVLPFAFLKSGMVANESSIQKKNMFGDTTWQVTYSEIQEIDVSVKFGIQYQIRTKSDEEFLFCSDAAVYGKTFRDDWALMMFDKVVSKYAPKTVTDDPAWLKPDNTKRFFEEQEVFLYFDEFFVNYYR